MPEGIASTQDLARAERELNERHGALAQEVQELRSSLRHALSEVVRIQTRQVELDARLSTILAAPALQDSTVEPFPADHLPPVGEYDSCVRAACYLTGSTPEAVQSPSRVTCHTEARRFIWYWLYHRGYSLTSIGSLSGRDHTTILHGVRRMENTLAAASAPPQHVLEWADRYGKPTQTKHNKGLEEHSNALNATQNGAAP